MSDEKPTLLEWSMADWRVADQADDDLTDLQRSPWKLRISEGGYGGLYIEAEAPDGTRRVVSLEVNMGNLHATVGAEPDDMNAIIQIGQNETRAVAMNPQPGRKIDGARFTSESGMEATQGDIENGCTTTSGIAPN